MRHENGGSRFSSRLCSDCAPGHGTRADLLVLPLCHDRVILGKREEEAWLGKRDDSELCVRREYFIVYSGQFLEQHQKVIPSGMHIPITWQLAKKDGPRPAGTLNQHASTTCIKAAPNMYNPAVRPLQAICPQPRVAARDRLLLIR